MIRTTVLLAASLLFITPANAADKPAQPPAAKVTEKPAKDNWLLDRSLTVTPRPAPVPALQYCLFPLASERKAGNAVPIYLRLIHEQTDARRKYWSEMPRAWNELPIDVIPLAEASPTMSSASALSAMQLFSACSASS